MSSVETRLAVALVVAPGALALLAAVLALRARSQRYAAHVLLAAVACAVLAVALALTRWQGRLPADVPLFVWSPLGLYGVTFVVRPTPDVALLMLPTLALAVLGAWSSGCQTPAQRYQQAVFLAALGTACLATGGGDLVSLHLAASGFLLATGAALWVSAGPEPALRRLLLAAVAAAGSLLCVLVLGKVNGHFRLAQLSTAGFTGAPFAGLLLAAAACGPMPPFHGWLVRAGRHRLAPALAAAGAAVAVTLMLAAFRIAEGQFPVSWQRLLASLGWVAVLLGCGVALPGRALPLRLAAVVVARTGLIFLAAAVATPVSISAMLLDATLRLPVIGCLWLLVTTRPVTTGDHSRQVDSWWRQPGFWIQALLVSTAAGLPGTMGGLTNGALITALTAWPSGSQLLRLPVLLLDVTTLVVAGRALWQPTRLGELAGWRGWTALTLAAVLLVGPVVSPEVTLERWFGAIAAAAAGTGGAPLMLHVSRVPTLPSAILGLVAALALIQHLRRQEWLPAPALAGLGILYVAWQRARLGVRRGSWSAAPAAGAAALGRRVEALLERTMALLRPLEERYYAAAAVMLAVALIYIIGR